MGWPGLSLRSPGMSVHTGASTTQPRPPNSPPTTHHSPQRVSPIAHYGRSGHIAGSVAGEIESERPDLFRLAEPAHGHHAFEGVFQFRHFAKPTPVGIC